jgi:hypothetical protein
VTGDEYVEPVEPRALRVCELVALLQALPPEAQQLPVQTEGCDCHGDVGGVMDVSKPEHFTTAVLILRPEGGVEQYNERARAVVKDTRERLPA